MYLSILLDIILLHQIGSVLELWTKLNVQIGAGRHVSHPC